MLHSQLQIAERRSWMFKFEFFPVRYIYVVYIYFVVRFQFLVIFIFICIFCRVPKDENTRDEWANNIKNYFKTEMKFKNCAYVCAMHFESSCFNYGGLCKVLRLKKGSCPTKFEKVEENEPIQSSSSANISDLLNDGIDLSLKESTVPLSSTDSTNNVSILLIIFMKTILLKRMV